MGKESNRRRTNGLVALSSAAVLSVYAAGFFKTRAAADQLEGEAARRRTAAPVAIVAAAPATDVASVEPRMAAAPQPATVPAAAAESTARFAPAPVPTIAPVPAKVEASSAPAAGSKSAAAADDASARLAAPKAAPAPVITAPPATEPVAPVADLVEPAAPAVAAATAEVPPVTEGSAPPQPGDAVPIKYKDGKYYGWGSCRHGRIQARVIIEGGRITSSSITKCNTRYDCSWIKSIVPQVVERQSAEVDYVTGATESADAFYYAVVEALNQAR